MAAIKANNEKRQAGCLPFEFCRGWVKKRYRVDLRRKHGASCVNEEKQRNRVIAHEKTMSPNLKGKFIMHKNVQSTNDAKKVQSDTILPSNTKTPARRKFAFKLVQ